MADTAARLTALAREWTVARGFSGFTLEELSAAVGISRRSFFNYFAAKEDAVLGVQTRVDHRVAEDRFVSGGGPSGPTGVSASLLPDLAELMIGRWEALGLGSQDVDALLAAIEAEPRLLGRTMQLTREQEKDDIARVEQRERLPAGDLRAGMVVHLLGTVLRGAVEEHLAGPGREPLRAVFARRLDVARAVFAA